MKMRRLLIPVLILSFASAWAGVKIKMESQVEGQKQIRTGWLYIGDENRLRIDADVDDSGQPENTVVFRGDLQAMYMIDHGEQAYVRIDEERIAVLSERFAQAMQQMEEQLAQLPEHQRKIMQDMMNKNRPQNEEFRVDVRGVGEEDGFNKYEVWIGDTKRSEVWVTPPAEMNIPAESVQVFRNMSNFYEQLLSTFRNNPMMQTIGENPFPGFTQMNGFPVRIFHLEERQETRFSKAEAGELDPAQFEPPPDYIEMRPDFQ
ncbi:MAG: hypothetical protein JSU96_16835 [Acidobacteriota bacterium]|nr:MAG: hypothetical protein JSU96_16835 [Acidobacteriota bacterium]